MYADDIVLLAGSIKELKAMNVVASEYARMNRYRHNGGKSAVMLFNASPELRDRFASEAWELSGEKVEVQSRYKYLGVDLLQNTSDWRSHMERVLKRAEWVSRDLSWACRRDRGIRPRSAATLWQAIVRPIIEYASEMWAGDIPKLLVKRAERVQTDFARSILGIEEAQSVPNDFVRAEMGMERLQARWLKLRLGYWRRLHSARPERTLSMLARLRKTHAQWGGKWAKQNWMQSTRVLLDRVGLTSHWHVPRKSVWMPERQWKRLVYEAVERGEDVARAQRLRGMGASANRYLRVKRWGKTQPSRAKFGGERGRRGALVHESYLDDRRETVGRRLKLLCRAGCLPVLSRVGREEQWAEPLRRCLLCEQGVVETAEHMVLECSAHAMHREVLFRGVSEAMGTRLSTLPGQDQYEILLGIDIGCVSAEERVDRHFKTFLKKAWRGRKRLTCAVNRECDRLDTIWAMAA
jgi:hypothetical protein